MPPMSLAPARICGSRKASTAGIAWAAGARPPGATSQAASQASTVMRSSAPSEVDIACTRLRATVHSSGVMLWLRSRTKA